MASVQGVQSGIPFPTFQEKASQTLIQLTQAAKQGDWQKIEALINTAKTIQEQLLNEIYSSTSEPNRENLLELIRHLEVEISAHQEFLEDRFKGANKRKAIKDDSNIISRMIFVVKQFFTINTTQRRLADAILKAEKSITQGAQKGIRDAKTDLETLRQKVGELGLKKDAVYALSTLALKRLEKHLFAEPENIYQDHHGAKLVDLLLEKKPQPVKGENTYLQARKAQFYDKAVESLTLPKRDIANLSNQEIVNRIALLIGLRQFRPDPIVDSALHLLVNTLKSTIRPNLLTNTNQFQEVEKELAAYPNVKSAFDAYMKTSYQRPAKIADTLLQESSPSLEALALPNAATWNRSKEEVADKIGALLFLKTHQPETNADATLYALINNLRGYPKQWDEVMRELEDFPAVQKTFSKYFKESFKRRLTEESIPGATPEKVTEIHGLVEAVERGEITAELWSKFAALSSQERTRLFLAHTNLREQMQPFAREIEKRVKEESIKLPLEDIQFVLSTLILTEDLLGRDVISALIKLVHSNYLEAKHIDIESRLASFPIILEGIRKRNTHAATQLEGLFINAMGNICVQDLKQLSKRDFPFQQVTTLLGEIDTPLKKAIALKAFDRASEEVYALGLRATTLYELEKTVFPRLKQLQTDAAIIDPLWKENDAKVEALQQRKIPQLQKEEKLAEQEIFAMKKDTESEIVLRELGLLTKESSLANAKTGKKNEKELVASFKNLMHEYNSGKYVRKDLFKNYVALEREIDKSGVALPGIDRSTANFILAELAGSYIDDIAKIPGIQPMDYINALIKGPFAAPHLEDAKTLFLKEIQEYLR
jgi:hypothetical protein